MFSSSSGYKVMFSSSSSSSDHFITSLYDIELFDLSVLYEALLCNRGGHLSLMESEKLSTELSDRM